MTEFNKTDITYQKHDGQLHFATDAWTSPNHRAYTLVTVHFEYKGEAVCLILDVVEVAKVSFRDYLLNFAIKLTYQ